MRGKSACGCVWERRKGYGDVVVVQCLIHLREGRSERARAAARAADRAVRFGRLVGLYR